MPTKIFVGNVGKGARPQDLRKLFESFGSVVECDVVNRCAFVHMFDEQDAREAIATLNNTTFDGQTISVEWGRQRDSGSTGQSRPMRTAPYHREGGHNNSGGGHIRNAMSQSGGGHFDNPWVRGGPPPKPYGDDRRRFASPGNDRSTNKSYDNFPCPRNNYDSFREDYPGTYDRSGYSQDTYQQRNSSGPMRSDRNTFRRNNYRMGDSNNYRQEELPIGDNRHAVEYGVTRGWSGGQSSRGSYDRMGSDRQFVGTDHGSPYIGGGRGGGGGPAYSRRGGDTGGVDRYI